MESNVIDFDRYLDFKDLRRLYAEFHQKFSDMAGRSRYAGYAMNFRGPIDQKYLELFEKGVLISVARADNTDPQFESLIQWKRDITQFTDRLRLWLRLLDDTVGVEQMLQIYSQEVERRGW